MLPNQVADSFKLGTSGGKSSFNDSNVRVLVT